KRARVADGIEAVGAADAAVVTTALSRWPLSGWPLSGWPPATPPAPGVTRGILTLPWRVELIAGLAEARGLPAGVPIVWPVAGMPALGKPGIRIVRTLRVPAPPIAAPAPATHLTSTCAIARWGRHVAQ